MLVNISMQVPEQQKMHVHCSFCMTKMPMRRLDFLGFPWSAVVVCKSFGLPLANLDGVLVSQTEGEPQLASPSPRPESIGSGCFSPNPNGLSGSDSSASSPSGPWFSHSWLTTSTNVAAPAARDELVAPARLGGVLISPPTERIWTF